MKIFTFLSLIGTVTAAAIEQRDPGVGCPGVLKTNGKYVGPRGLYPIQRTEPDKNFGDTSPSVVITPNDTCTIFDIYLPPRAFAQACNLKFFFPNQNQLAAGSSYRYQGPGNFYLAGYTGRGTNSSVTWNTQPKPDPAFISPGAKVLAPGNVYNIFGGLPFTCLGAVNFTTFPWSIGEFRVGGRLCSNDTTFVYQQNANNCPIGLFVEYT